MATTFAIAAEGVTDQRVIDNIVTGFFSDRVDGIEVRWDQPPHDEPGGWGRLFTYLRLKEYRATFQYNDYLILQVDSDRSFDVGFDVPHQTNGKNLEVDALIRAIREKLEKLIGDDDLQTYEGRFLCAICVHTIECWLLPLHGYARDAAKIRNCKYCVDAGLRRANTEPLNKDRVATYTNASAPYRRRRILLDEGTKQRSLAVFLESLTPIGGN